MIEAMIERHAELKEHAEKYGTLLTREAVEWKGIKEILGDFGFTYMACS